MSDLGLGPLLVLDRGVERNPPLIGDQRENVRSRTGPPPGFGHGGGKEPALNTGLTGERPTSDLAYVLSVDRVGGRRLI
jgi:hypothetical protein